ncbi:codeine O-demethylase [Amborella trichopoda]|uniref:codeine O-demethylase n=1 Tax=Amborella trichopoda TaxID=13333 RepID=UPI0005D3CEDC|nr:codeine O-demethylase [Amborella trichopoda]|eukprot:XP_006852848.2 codeine O-demethylase [Amborella trichopoda]
MGESMRVPMVQEVAARGEEIPQRYHCKEDKPSTFCQAQNVPTIDMDLLLASSPMPPMYWEEARNQEKEKLKDALQNWGFFQAVGHGISEDLMDGMRRAMKEFFELPFQEKMKVAPSIECDKKSWLDGYAHDPLESDEQILDWCDRLYLQTFPRNKIKLEFWPEKPATFREVLDELSLKMKEFADKTLTLLGEMAGLKDKYFNDHFDDDATLYARFNYYPPCSKPGQTLGQRSHSDNSGITVLIQDPHVQGIQVLRDGTWHQIKTLPYALLINIGDQLEVMSNGIIRSAVHRVIVNKEKPRMTMAMFYSMAPNKELGPAEELAGKKESPAVYQKILINDYFNVFLDCWTKKKRAIDTLKI